MRTAGCLGVVGAVFLGLSGAVRADDGKTASALIARAIIAHGGEAGLLKMQTVARSSTGVLSLGASELSFSGEATFALPGRVKQTLKLNKGGQVLLVLNGDRGWRSAGGSIMEMTKEGLDEVREEIYVEWLTTLVPLTKTGFDLAPVADKMVEGKAAAGVKVASKGHGDVQMYFEKTSGLLVKIERVSKEAGVSMNKEYVFSAHKAFEGVNLPTKRMESLNGKKVLELSSSSYRFLGKVDDTMFGRP